MTITNSFAQDLRRVLFLCQIIRYEIEAIKEQPEAVQCKLKAPLNNLCNSVNRLLLELYSVSSKQSWQTICEALTSDELREISTIIEFCTGRDGVEEFLPALQELVKNKET